MVLENMNFWTGEIDSSFFNDLIHYKKTGVILLGISGGAIVEVGVQENQIIKNTEMIILPGITVTLISNSSDFRARVFTFSKKDYDEVMFKLNPNFPLQLSLQCTVLHDNESIYLTNIISFMNMAIVIFNEGENEYRGLMEKNFVHNYLIYLFDKCRHHFENFINKITRKQHIFHNFLVLLNEHFSSQHNVKFYADQLFITPRYLSMIVHECSSYGSPKELIDKRILIEIKALLQQTDLSVQEIAGKLNFPDQSYLGRYFKRYTMMSPTAFREKIDENKIYG